MTVKELIAFLKTVPQDATIIYSSGRFIADTIIYDDCENTVSFAGLEEFDDIPDDVDETNYDPYSGCNIYE